MSLVWGYLTRALFCQMCVNQRCRDVLSLRKQTPHCDKDCHGNGWCNSLGHCHCKDGFAPPLCEYPGPGGSEDSGPASDPNGTHSKTPKTKKNMVLSSVAAHQGVVVAMFIIFLGVVPMVALTAILLYYARYNLKLSWPKTPTTATYVARAPQGGGFREGVAICRPALISTTNVEGIVRSNTISQSIKCLVGGASAKPPTVA